MTKMLWQAACGRILSNSLTVDEIKDQLIDLDDTDKSRVKTAVQQQRAMVVHEFPEIADRRDKTDYYNLVVRVINDLSPVEYKQPKMIMDGAVYLVPVAWSDDKTMDASVNGNIERWLKAGTIGQRHLAVARETDAEALHLFEPHALNSRTAHVTTASFIRLMESRKGNNE